MLYTYNSYITIWYDNRKNLKQNTYYGINTNKNKYCELWTFYVSREKKIIFGGKVEDLKPPSKLRILDAPVRYSTSVKRSAQS